MYKLNQKTIILSTLSLIVISVLSSVLYVTYNRRNISKFCCSHEIQEQSVYLDILAIFKNVPNCTTGEWNFKCKDSYSIRQEFVPKNVLFDDAFNFVEKHFLHNSTHHVKGFVEKSSKLHINHTIWDESE